VESTGQAAEHKNMTEKTLVIAEKPSVAADLVKVLPGKFTKSKTHYESDAYIVSYAIGHLVSICYPEEIDEKYKKWNLVNLPIIPETFPLKAIKGTSSQLNALKKLIRRTDVTQIINACDAGREGELIFKYILQFTRTKSVDSKTVKRLWLQSMTRDAIKQGFMHLRNDAAMKSLEETAVCRSESDWLIGINASRALTAYNSRKGGFFKTPCGRVQTPTLSMIVLREKERLAFKPQTYFQIEASFLLEDGESDYAAKWIDPQFKKEEDHPHKKADRLWSRESAEAIIAKCAGQPAQVEDSSKSSRQRSPQLFDLTSLQREANSRFGFSARNTLSIAQALYERHKVLTYPRSDSRYLPEDYPAEVKKSLAIHAKGAFGKFAAEILQKNYVKKDKRIFDNSKVSDHHALIPTNILPADLSEAEQKIYNMVMQRFLAVFYPEAEYLITRRLSRVAEESFLTEGKILQKAGWKAVYGADLAKEKDEMVAVPEGTHPLCHRIELKEDSTKPPPRFTEATLLSAMENSGKNVEDEDLREAMKERGLGTPATRAATIEGLIKEKYINREQRELVPSGKAFDLINLIEGMKIEELALPELTGEWEYKMNQVLKGDFTAEKFMAEIRQLTEKIVERVKTFCDEDGGREASFSPVDGRRILDTPTAYVSEDGGLSIRKVLGGRVMNEEEIVALLKGETLGPFDNFRSKKGKQFSAMLKLEGSKIEFVFPDNQAETNIELLKTQEPLGRSPVDDTFVYETPFAFVSESALQPGGKAGLKISKRILDRQIEAKHIRQLLEEGKTELIQGFISKKKRPFDAYLLLDNKGKISFEFPPRKGKNRVKEEG
jgi:DNA topoisomerase-3